MDHFNDSEFDSEKVAKDEARRKFDRLLAVLLAAALFAAILLHLANPPTARKDRPYQPIYEHPPALQVPDDLTPTFTFAQFDFGKTERFKSGPLRIAPYPQLQTAKYGGATVKVTVFVEPQPEKRHLRVEWYYNGEPKGGAERDLDGESRVEYSWNAHGVPPGDVMIVATIRERRDDGKLGKVLHRVEKKALVRG